MKYVFAGIVVFMLFAACTPFEETIYDRVPNVDNELLYHDVFADKVPADQIVAFGIKLGDSTEKIIELHGEPDYSADYEFGRIRNLEYEFNLSQEDSAVLYHTERGVVAGILVTDKANPVLHGQTVLDQNITILYENLGLPTRADFIGFERNYIYDEYGYEFFAKQNEINRVYLSQPNQGIEPVGKEEPSDVCVQVITPAINFATGECIEFPNPCIVPEDWQVVDACEE